jgi:hypothetical protein
MSFDELLKERTKLGRNTHFLGNPFSSPVDTIVRAILPISLSDEDPELTPILG